MFTSPFEGHQEQRLPIWAACGIAQEFVLLKPSPHPNPGPLSQTIWGRGPHSQSVGAQIYVIDSHHSSAMCPFSFRSEADKEREGTYTWPLPFQPHSGQV